MPLYRSKPVRAKLAMAVAVAAGILAAPAVASANVSPAPPPAAPPTIIPKPVSMTIGSGTFQLTAKSRILATSPAARQIAKVLAADLAPSTGWHLRVGSGAAKAGDIQLILGNPGTLSDDTLHEGYQLNVNASVATLTAPTSDGLLNGVQTIRQLFPAWVDRSSVEPGPWTMPAVSITDYPRYAYRGT